MLEQGFQQVSSCGQLSPHPAGCPLSPCLLKGPWTWGHRFLSLTQATVSMVVKSPSGIKISSQDREECVCSHLCHWQKFNYMVAHTSAHPGMWQGCLGEAAAHFPLEGEQLCCEQLLQYEMQNLRAWNAKYNKTINTYCKLLAIDSSILHIIQTKAVVMAADKDSYCLVMPAFSCMVSAQIL